MSTVFAILTVWSGLHFLQFSVLSGSTLFAILSLLRVYTVCHSQQSDQSLHYLPFSAVWSRSRSTLLFSGAVWSGSTFCHSQLSDQGLHYLQSSAFWSGSTLFAIHNLIGVYTICHSQYDQGLQHLPFSAVWTRGTLYLPFFLSSIIKVCTVCHSHHSDQGLHNLPFSVWSRTTLFVILSNLIRDYTGRHSQHPACGLYCL